MGYYQISDFSKHLKNPHKYKGAYPITLRSSWEIKFAIWLDKDSSVLEWNSETVVIPYLFYDAARRCNRTHRYFTDFWMKVLTKENTVKEFLIEIKPHAETQPPKEPKRITKAHNRRVYQYMKNQAKWKAAQEFCEEQQKHGKDIEFMVLTEKDLPVR